MKRGSVEAAMGTAGDSTSPAVRAGFLEEALGPQETASVLSFPFVREHPSKWVPSHRPLCAAGTRNPEGPLPGGPILTVATVRSPHGEDMGPCPGRGWPADGSCPLCCVYVNCRYF